MINNELVLVECSSYVRNSSSDFKFAKCDLTSHMRADGSVYCLYYLRYVPASSCFRIVFGHRRKFYLNDKLVNIDQLTLL